MGGASTSSCLYRLIWQVKTFSCWFRLMGLLMDSQSWWVGARSRGCSWVCSGVHSWQNLSGCGSSLVPGCSGGLDWCVSWWVSAWAELLMDWQHSWEGLESSQRSISGTAVRLRLAGLSPGACQGLSQRDPWLAGLLVDCGSAG